LLSDIDFPRFAGLQAASGAKHNLKKPEPDPRRISRNNLVWAGSLAAAPGLRGKSVRRRTLKNPRAVKLGYKQPG
jgi:hypothetical protein